MEGKPGRFLQGKDHRRWLLGTREVVVSSVCVCVCVYVGGPPTSSARERKQDEAAGAA